MMTAIIHWLLYATYGAIAIVGGVVIIAGTGLWLAVVITGAVRNRRRQRACNSMAAALRESDGIGDDVVGFTCPRCDDSRPRAQCTCLGDCSRRDCPWGEADRDLDVLRSDDAFNAAIAQLHAELDAAERDEQ